MAENKKSQKEPAPAGKEDSKFSHQHCSDPGCSYCAIVRRPLCVFHGKDEEYTRESLRRDLQKAPTLRQLREREAQLLEELAEVRGRMGVARRADEEEARRTARKAAAERGEAQGSRGRTDTFYRRCSAEGCANHAIRGGVCVRHGATGKKPCRIEGCPNQSAKGGVCFRHGAQLRRCGVDGCQKLAQQGGVCIRHGARVKICSVEDCTNQARRGGVCRRHGAKNECSFEGCTKQAQKAGVCWSHGANEFLSKKKRKIDQQQQQQQEQEVDPTMVCFPAGV